MMRSRSLTPLSSGMALSRRALIQRGTALGLSPSLAPLGAASGGLALLAAPRPAGSAPSPQAQPLTVLYRREAAGASARLDPVVQTATLALEEEFQAQGLRVMQPSAQVYQLMDGGPGVVVTFAENAGYSMVFSAYRNLRPVPGQEAGIAEVRLQARVFVGRQILVSDEGRGQMFTRLEDGQQEFGERRALELAARQAARELAQRTGQRLRQHSLAPVKPGGNADLVASSQTISTPETQLPPAAPPPPPPAPPAPAPSPAPATVPVPASSSGAVPVPVPVPAPAPAPATDSLSLPPPGKRWALVIGVSDYGPVRERLGVKNPSDLSDLPGVAKDVVNFRKSLMDLGVPADHIWTLRESDATTYKINLALKLLVDKLAPDDMVTVFLSAHGGSKEGSVSGYGAPILFDYDQKESSLDFWQLQSLCMGLPCQQVLWVIDTCFSGNAARNLVTVEVSSTGVQAAQGVGGPDAKRVARGALGGQKHFAVLTAASSNEISWDAPSKGGGLFTALLLSSLRDNRSRRSVAEVVREQVAPKVISESRVMCKANHDCKYPQQTPVFAYAGLGNQIKL